MIRLLIHLIFVFTVTSVCYAKSNIHTVSQFMMSKCIFSDRENSICPDTFKIYKTDKKLKNKIDNTLIEHDMKWGDFDMGESLDKNSVYYFKSKSYLEFSLWQKNNSFNGENYDAYLFYDYINNKIILLLADGDKNLYLYGDNSDSMLEAFSKTKIAQVYNLDKNTLEKLYMLTTKNIPYSSKKPIYPEVEKITKDNYNSKTSNSNESTYQGLSSKCNLYSSLGEQLLRARYDGITKDKLAEVGVSQDSGTKRLLNMAYAVKKFSKYNEKENSIKNFTHNAYKECMAGKITFR